MNSVVLGQYVPGKSFLYKLDPRVKILSVIILMIAVFLLKSLLEIGIALGIILAVLIIGKINLVKVLKGLKPIMIFLLFTVIFQILFNKSGDVLVESTHYFTIYSLLAILCLTVIWLFLRKRLPFKLLGTIAYLLGIYFITRYINYGYELFNGNFTLYSRAVFDSVFVIVRLIIIVMLSTILTLTTKPNDLNLGIEKLLMPLKKIKLEPENYALIISISLRYIPTIFDEANKIMMAQASRGSDFKEGKLKDKIMQIVSLLVPMFIIAIIRSDNLASAMDARNFVPGKTRTKLHELKWRAFDTFAMIIVFVILSITVVLKVV